MLKYAVVLFNLGGPDSFDAIEAFLYNIFSDPDIFKLPFGQKFFAKLLTKYRVEKVRERYRKIGGKSPINEWTELQRSMLEEELSRVITNITVFTAMRYWNPGIPDVAEKILEYDFDKVVLLPLYPQYSVTTTGSSFNEWKRAYRGDPLKLVYVSDYFDNRTYISALNERIDEAVLRLPKESRNEIQMVFSAHGTPENLVKKGDPYSHEIRRTVECVMEARHFSCEYHLCFQSRVGPLKWIGPSTGEMIEELAKKDRKHLLMIPISFVSDQIETLFDLEIHYRALARKANIENYVVMQGLNDSRLFISALKEIVINALHLDPAPDQKQ